MLLFENISSALSGLLANKLRALLTMLGIIIGISSVIAIVTVGNSMTAGMNEEMQSWGAGNISVYLQQRPQQTGTADASGVTADDSAAYPAEGGDTAAYMFTSEPEEQDYITDEMAARLKAQLSDSIAAVQMTEQLSASQATRAEKTADITISGVNGDYFTVTKLHLLTGRFLNEKDSAAKRRVCVVSSKLTGKLFPGADPIGKTIDVKIGDQIYSFYVVGVYAHKEQTGVFSYTGDTSTAVYVPIGTAKYINNAKAGYRELTVIGKPGTDVKALSAEIDEFFKRAYAQNRSFLPVSYNNQEYVESSNKTMNMISLAISVIAGISLLVGGIGVMNIMLVSITERTREIGVRKALGATNGSIRLQFIVESIVICLLGGLIGIALGLTLGAVGSKLVGYAARPSAAVILIAVGFSMLIGVFFGYYPANKAAKLDPIEALRYE
ncbi:MAG: ABC transporter permease [Oscillospiraceae bacterium]|nr:ABC transporter permease [Oscillospiraceae bacterium]